MIVFTKPSKMKLVLILSSCLGKPLKKTKCAKTIFKVIHEKTVFEFFSIIEDFLKNRYQEHLTLEEVDGLEKLRSLLFHHSWQDEAALLASHIKLDNDIIFAIKSIEGKGSTRAYYKINIVRKALNNLDIRTKDIKLRIYSDFLNIFKEEFAHRYFKK